MIKAKATEAAFPVGLVSEAIRGLFKTVSRCDPNYFQSEKETWIRVKAEMPQITDKALALRLSEIERDKKLFGDSTPAVLVEGITAEDIPVKCLIGERLFTAKFSRVLNADEKEPSANVLLSIKKLVLSLCFGAEFDDGPA